MVRRSTCPSKAQRALRSTSNRSRNEPWWRLPPAAALSSLSLPDPSSHPLYRLWLNFIRVVSCNDRGRAEVEVSLVQSVQLRFSECKTKGVTYLGMGSLLLIAPFHEGFGRRNPCVFFCAGRSLAQFSQSIKFEGIDAEITLCLSVSVARRA